MKFRDSLTMRPTLLRKLVFYSLLATCYSLLLTSCGWHLRGSIDFPPSMEKIYVEGTARYSELGSAIHNAFAGTNSTLVSSPSQAQAILRILSDKADKRILATDSSGRASEYEISYLLRFKLVDIKGLDLVREQQVKATREYRFDPDNVMSTGGEVERLQKDMIRISVQQMLRRINASLRAK